MEFQITPSLLFSNSSSVALGSTLGGSIHLAQQLTAANIGQNNIRRPNQQQFLIPLLNILTLNTIPFLNHQPNQQQQSVNSNSNNNKNSSSAPNSNTNTNSNSITNRTGVVEGAGDNGQPIKIILPSNPIYGQLLQYPYLFFERFVIQAQTTTTTTTTTPSTTTSRAHLTSTLVPDTNNVTSNATTTVITPTTTIGTTTAPININSANCGLSIEQLEQGQLSDEDNENGVPNFRPLYPRPSPIGVRIVGGQDSNYRNIPWQISLQKYTVRNAYGNYFGQRRPQYRHFCGGSVISDRWLITAAHCLEWTLDPQNSSVVLPQALRKLRIVYGTDKVFPPSYRPSSQTTTYNNRYYRSTSSGYDSRNYGNYHRPHRQPPESSYCYAEVCDLIVNPDFKNVSSRNDIALIRLCQPLPLYPKSNKVNQICLPQVVDQKFEGTASASGWGRIAEYGKLSDGLQVVNVTVLPDRRCNMAYGYHYDQKLMICAAGQNQDSCQGDSGGPLFQNNPKTGHATLIGTVSFGYGCGRRRFPGIYTKISHFLPWIWDTINNADKIPNN